MKRVGVVLVAAAAILATAACSGSDSGADGSRSGSSATGALGNTTQAAVDLLQKSAPHGYGSTPVASGHERADNTGEQISETVTGRSLFLIACSGNGEITVTMTAQASGKMVKCGDQAEGFPFRGDLNALVVGEATNTGAFAWEILTKS